ncbi:MAG TPA: PD-(D/E)XK nuclease family protein [Thermoanaerobaculia bacterium]
MPLPFDSARPAGGGPAPRVLVAPGARAAEEALLALVESALAGGGIAALGRPVRVIVPSRSLRLHLAAAVARRRGRAAAGLVVQTLYAAAMEVLERADVAPRVSGAGGDLAFEVLVRRAARRQRALAERLESLVDGYGAAAATVRDLLDAGFEEAHAEAAGEALAGAAAAGVPRDEVERARALVATAVEVERDLARHGGERRSAVLRRATDLLSADPERLPARAVLVHGFSDATGLATDFLEALVRQRGTTVIVETPPDPLAAAGGAPAPETAHGERLRERLGGAAGLAPAPVAAPAAPRLDRFSAAGAETEAREVALRARALLDGGVSPEAVALVARDLGPHRLALRRQLAALGVPFSGLGETGSLGAGGRRAQALLDLLRRGRDLPADRWLDAAGSLPRDGGRRRRGPFVDLRLALSSLGAGRLGDVASLDLDRVLGDREWLPLPILRGLAGGRREDEADDDPDEAREDPARPARRTVGRDELALAVAAARRLVARLADWPERAPVGEHLRRLGGLVVQELGWRGGGPGGAAAGPGGAREAPEPVLAALDRLAADLPPGLALDREELRLVLGRALEEAGRDALGGRGGGVQVLSVTEARGRTFEHLFLVGANRNAFPRPVRQDPLLADDLRAALAPVLPDLSRKQAGFDEERWLFAHLLSAAPRVTISWWSRDDDGRAVAPSPLVERLPADEPAAVAATAHALAPPDGPRPAAESAAVAALHGATRTRFRQLLAVAIGEEQAGEAVEGRAGAGGVDGDPGLAALRLAHTPAALAAARVAVLDEVDPDLRTPEGRAAAAGLGPYFGFVGRRGGAGDARAADLWVTQAENLAACPWQLFLERLLRIEPTPDPLEALPGTDPLLLGNVVHAVLEELATDAGAPSGEPLADALAPRRPAAPVVWPGAEYLERRTLAAARRVLLDEGVPLAGLARALASQALAFLARAAALDWHPADGTLAVLAVEAIGEVTVADDTGRPRRLSFKADRVDRAGADAAVRLTDYKTGRPLSTAKTAKTLRDHHLRRVREGRNLQATAYHLGAAAASGAAALGRYLYLRPDADPRTVELAVGADDPEFADRFAATARAAFAAWDAGGFFPRVVDPAGEKEPARCSFCRVAEACLRGDSGARRRLHRWASEAAAPGSDAERAVLGVWRLHDPRAEGEGEQIDKEAES